MGQCKKCLEEKIMEYSHLGTNGAKLYKDDKGRFWKGKVCPECQNKLRNEQRHTKVEQIKVDG